MEIIVNWDYIVNVPVKHAKQLILKSETKAKKSHKLQRYFIIKLIY